MDRLNPIIKERYWEKKKTYEKDPYKNHNNLKLTVSQTGHLRACLSAWQRWQIGPSDIGKKFWTPMALSHSAHVKQFSWNTCPLYSIFLCAVREQTDD